MGIGEKSVVAQAKRLLPRSHKLAEEMYKKASAEAATAGSPGEETSTDTTESSASDEKVVDAEFEEVDKDKK